MTVYSNYSKKFALLTLLASLTLFSACGDSDDDKDNNHAHHNNANNHGHVSETVHPLGSAKTDNGHFTVLAAHDPAAPVQGTGKLTLTVTNADVPVDGLTITVTPWMPAHGHGSNKTPVVTEKGAGIYEVTDVLYTMPGDWEARIALKNADHKDTIAFGFSVK